jgi:acylphosphatase
MIAKRVVVTGMVQGVGFRWATRDQAVRLGVNGWVRNRADGSVETHLEGPRLSVDDLVDWLRRGPVGSAVADLSVERSEPEGIRGFEITR